MVQPSFALVSMTRTTPLSTSNTCRCCSACPTVGHLLVLSHQLLSVLCRHCVLWHLLCLFLYPVHADAGSIYASSPNFRGGVRQQSRQLSRGPGRFRQHVRASCQYSDLRLVGAIVFWGYLPAVYIRSGSKHTLPGRQKLSSMNTIISTLTSSILNFPGPAVTASAIWATLHCSQQTSCFVALEVRDCPTSHASYVTTQALLDDPALCTATCQCHLPFWQMFACTQVWLVAVDIAGNAQDSPTLISLQTAPDTTAPALLAGSGAESVRLPTLTIATICAAAQS